MNNFVLRNVDPKKNIDPQPIEPVFYHHYAKMQPVNPLCSTVYSPTEVQDKWS